MNEVVVDDTRGIPYVSSKEKSRQFFERFKGHREKEFTSAVATLQGSLQFRVSFMHFPDDERISQRTSNILERLNKEFTHKI